MAQTISDGVAQADGPPGGWVFTTAGDATLLADGVLSAPTANGNGGIYASQLPTGYATSGYNDVAGTSEQGGWVWPIDMSNAPPSMLNSPSFLIEAWVNGQTGPADTNMSPASGPVTFVGTLPNHTAAPAAGGWSLGLTAAGTVAFTYVASPNSPGNQPADGAQALHTIDTGVRIPNQAWSCLQVAGYNTLNPDAGVRYGFGIYLNGSQIDQGGQSDVYLHPFWVPNSAADATDAALWIGGDASGAGEAGALIGGVIVTAVAGFSVDSTTGTGPGAPSLLTDPLPYTPAMYTNGPASTGAFGQGTPIGMVIGFGNGDAGSGSGSSGPATGAVAVEPSAPMLNARGTSAPTNSIAAFTPTPTLSAWQVAPAPSGAALILPLPVMAGSGVVLKLALPAPILSTQGVAGTTGAVVLTLPLPRGVSVSIEPGITGAVSLRAPMPVLTATSALRTALVFPKPSVSMTARVGVAARAALTAPMPIMGAQVLLHGVASVAMTAPMPSLSAHLSVGAAARVNAALARFALAAQGVTGNIGRVAVTMPLVQLDPIAVQSITGAAAVELPALLMQATGFSAAAAPTFFPALVMHTETQALTQYDDFPFNSFAAFNGAYLAASDAGVFVLGGDTDNGTLIQACARVGMTDFETSHLKRVDRCYVGYRASGDMVLRVICDETDTREYRLADTHETGLHGNHVRIGRGLYARYWQFELVNRLGSDFTLDMIELEPTKLRRRRGGRDA